MTDDRYERVTWHDGGKTVNKWTAAALEEVQRRLGYPLTVVQGSYNAGGVGASAGTHDGGGAVDLLAWDWENKVHALRAVGFAAWHRPTLPGVWNEHIHCILVGDEDASPAAKAQITDYRNHRDGLASHAPDNTWHPDPIPIFAYPPKPPPKPEPTTVRVPVAHVSMQYSDTFDQMTSDAQRIFKRAADGDMGWVTGTEAGEEPLKSILRDAADAAGFRFYANRGQWIAVDRGLIKGAWDTGYVPVLESTQGRGKHTDRGITWVTFDTANLGRITIGCGHYLTDGREPGDPNYKLNLNYAETIGKWGEAAGSDTALVFYHGDQNINDASDDTFHGQPFTSAQDELGKHESTGHGPIDVIASYDKDVRVKAVDVRVLDDSEFRLNTDHFFVVAVFEIRVLA